MTIVYLIVGAVLDIKVIPQTFNRWRFEDLKKYYTARWKRLSFEEKVSLLYAEKSCILEREQRDLQQTVREEGGARLDALLDAHVSSMSHTIKRCPKFESLTEAELDRFFYKILEQDWQAMKLSNNYDFHDSRLNLDRLFSEHTQLSKLFKDKAEGKLPLV